MVLLIPMSEDELNAYLQGAIPRYAEEHIRWNLWDADNAYTRAEQIIYARLPEGINTSDQHLFCIQRVMDSETLHVGYLWFAVQEYDTKSVAFVYDMVIDQKYRRRGYGADAFHHLEAKVREFGLDTIMLQVFGDNDGARALYESLGFATSNIRMMKRLPQSDSHQDA